MPAPGAGMKKQYGQHFLADPNILGVIERLAELGPDDVVLEIGPGEGVLTRYLAERVRAGPRGRDRPRPRARAARDRAERRRRLRRRAPARPAARRDEARREPSVQRRDAAHRREPRRAPEHRPLVRDGAAGGRRPALRLAGDEGLRRGLGARPARCRANRLPPGLADGLPAAAERRLGARRLPAHGAARELRPDQGSRRGRVRAPAQDAPELARVRRARHARARGGGARSARPRRRTRAPRRSRPREFVALAEALA